MTLRPGSLLAAALALAGTPALAGAPAPGAYCPLPAAGETPRCLDPAVERYGGFFRALADDPPGDAGLAAVEGDVERGGSPDAYLALSSLAYAYYRLSQRAAERGGDPQVTARLERWNQLLGRAYRASGEDPAYRRALREAALDLQRRAPPVRLHCVDARGAESGCDSTDAVVRGLDAAAGDLGLGAALRRLFERFAGGSAP